MLIPRLNYSQYQKESSRIIAELQSELRIGSLCYIIENFPCSETDSALNEFTYALGEPVLEKRNRNNSSVYRVEINNHLSLPVYANTAYEFSGHTDCADFDNPPDTVVMLCERPSEIGGDSFLVNLETVLEEFSFKDVQMLNEPVYIFGKNYYPILSLKNTFLAIRYNRVYFDFCIRLNQLEIEPEKLELINRLDNAINACKYVFSLKSGDCLLLNNQRILHGRESFPENSDRLIKRVRLNLFQD